MQIVYWRKLSFTTRELPVIRETMFFTGLLLLLLVISSAASTPSPPSNPCVENNRPPVNERKFTSDVIENTLQEVTKKFFVFRCNNNHMPHRHFDDLLSLLSLRLVVSKRYAPRWWTRNLPSCLPTASLTASTPPSTTRQTTTTPESQTPLLSLEVI